MTKANDPVYPDPGFISGALGISTREYFAALAMQGLLAPAGNWQRDDIAHEAVIMADRLIAALNRDH